MMTNLTDYIRSAGTFFILSASEHINPTFTFYLFGFSVLIFYGMVAELYNEHNNS